MYIIYLYMWIAQSLMCVYTLLYLYDYIKHSININLILFNNRFIFYWTHPKKWLTIPTQRKKHKNLFAIQYIWPTSCSSRHPTISSWYLCASLIVLNNPITTKHDFNKKQQLSIWHKIMNPYICLKLRVYISYIYKGFCWNMLLKAYKY